MLKQTIQQNTTEALKAGDSFVAETLRMLLAAITTKEKEKKFKEKIEGDARLTDEEIIGVVTSEVKKRKDAIALYEKGNRPELAEKERKETEVLKKYLPEQLSTEELKKLVEESIKKIKSEIKDPSAGSGQVMGAVMKDLSPKIKGKVDGGAVSKLIKEILAK